MDWSVEAEYQVHVCQKSKPTARCVFVCGLYTVRLKHIQMLFYFFHFVQWDTTNKERDCPELCGTCPDPQL